MGIEAADRCDVVALAKIADFYWKLLGSCTLSSIIGGRSSEVTVKLKLKQLPILVHIT
jgi:hypothetical protein